ncbi:MAG: hopanoid biosynthesis-associated protein HpnK [Acetobacteraceae bacterium]|nr:hopanoid biosynthesis-associated protein HpnK [Acetobacteraceae bacterium]
MPAQRPAAERVLLCADDFGLCQSVNEAVEQAHREGALHAASLMVAGPAVADAVRRARALPRLRVGLHLVTIEGPAILPRRAIPDLIDARGWFPRDQFRLGWKYFFSAGARRQLAVEIRAQYEAFAATGLELDHANAHKHMHLHPVVGRLLIDIGREYGLRAVRIPAEPPRVLARCGARPSFGDRALYAWTRWLRRYASRAGLEMTDACFGLLWSGHMTAERISCLLAHLPPGTSEIYFHPATRKDPCLQALMRGYEHQAELAALMDAGVVANIGAAALCCQVSSRRSP